jgi:hypothetical protein
MQILLHVVAADGQAWLLLTVDTVAAAVAIWPCDGDCFGVA